MMRQIGFGAVLGIAFLIMVYLGGLWSPSGYVILKKYTVMEFKNRKCAHPQGVVTHRATRTLPFIFEYFEMSDLYGDAI